MQLLQQSEGTAAQCRIFFTMVDSVDLHTRKTGISVSIRISKNGTTAAGGGSVTEVDSTNLQGLYYYDASSELGTVGVFIIKATGTGCEPREIACQVVPWDPYDSVRLGMTDPIPDNGITAAKIATAAVDADAIASDAFGAAELAADAVNEIVAALPTTAGIADAVWDEDRASHTTAGSFGRAAQVHKDGTAQSGAAGTIRLDGLASAVDNFYKGSIIKLVEGTGAGQSRLIKSYTGATKDAAVYPDWVTAPDNTSKFVVEPFGGFGVAGAVLDELLASHTTAGSLGKAISDLLTQVARLLGLAHENAKLDGGDGFPNVQHTAGKLVFARLRVFADETALNAATAGAADDADNEVYRYEITVTYSGNDVATYQIAKVL